MLDDFLRDEEKPSTFLDELEQEAETLNLEDESNYGFLGMTPFQRFIIAGLLLLMVLIIGSFCLLITGSIALPLL
jgi:hypothetical protein